MKLASKMKYFAAGLMLMAATSAFSQTSASAMQKRMQNSKPASESIMGAKETSGTLSSEKDSLQGEKYLSARMKYSLQKEEYIAKYDSLISQISDTLKSKGIDTLKNNGVTSQEEEKFVSALTEFFKKCPVNFDEYDGMDFNYISFAKYDLYSTVGYDMGKLMGVPVEMAGALNHAFFKTKSFAVEMTGLFYFSSDSITTFYSCTYVMDDRDRSAIAYISLAKEFMKRKDYSECIYYAKIAAGLSQCSVTALNLAAHAEFANHNLPESIEWASKSIAVCPNRDAHSLRWIAYIFSGNSKDADKSVEDFFSVPNGRLDGFLKNQ